jgi:DNA-directed RNA polymerase I subunit RPA43
MSEALWKVTTTLALHINPRFIGNLHHAVELHINSLLLKYSEKMKGVPIACPQFLIRSTSAIVNTDFPLLHLEVLATMVVFAPAVGARLTGRVNQVSADHVGMLVMGCFNASIPSSKMKPSLKYDEEQSVWRTKGDQHLATNSLVTFDVTGFDYVDEVYYIQGSILSDDTGFAPSW